MIVQIATKEGLFQLDLPNSNGGSEGDVACTCPVCAPDRTKNHAKSKCGSFNVIKRLFNCHHCGARGIEKTERDTFLNEEMTIRPVNITFGSTEITPVWANWLRDVRHISLETALKMNLHTVSKSISWEHVPDDANQQAKALQGKYVLTECLAAFYVYKDLLVNVQYRDMWKNFAFEPSCDLVFFNGDEIVKHEVIVITEGWMDAVAFCEAGFQNVVSVPNGATITKKEKEIFDKTGVIEILSQPSLKYLDNQIKDFDNVREIVLATDNDAAGLKLMEVLRQRFTNMGKKVSRINFDIYSESGKPHKDFNDILIHFGKEAIANLYNKREVFQPAYIVRVGDLVRDVMADFKYGIKPARKLNWPGFDPHFGYYEGDILVGNGLPANGKTVFNQNLMTVISKGYNTRWLVYSPENYPPKLFLEAIIEIYTGMTFNQGNRQRVITESVLKSALEWSNEYFRFYDARKAPTLGMLRDAAVEMNCQGMFIDPWNRLVRDDKHSRKVISDYIQEELTEQIAFGRGTKITTIISVHPPTQDKKSRKYDEKGTYDHPSAYEAEGGKVWLSSAHVMYCPHRPNASDVADKTTNLYVQKLKDWKLYGFPTGDKIPLTFQMDATCRRLYLIDADGNRNHPLDTTPKQKRISYGTTAVTPATGEFDTANLPF